MEKDLISVIVPVYNTSKFLEKCIYSILNQTHKNLEVIIVNDASTDNSAEIIEKFKNFDNRVVVVTHEKNRGLFRARVSGVSVAKGDYIAFVDSDDYISMDYYRSLVKVAKEKHSDIVMGKIVHENTDGYKYVHNSYFNMKNVERRGTEVANKYFEQEGYCFIWHTVWNKIYSKRIWDKALSFFQTIEDHIIMCEDVLFSTILHTFAQSLDTTQYAYYFYMQHSGASTANDNNFKKFKKNIGDLVKVFNYVEQFLKSKPISEENLKHFENWKKLYSRFWYDNVNNSTLDGSNKSYLFNILKNGLALDEVVPTNEADGYFYRVTAKWDDRYDKIIRLISDETVKVFSLDVFDTIVVRPFLKPTDLFLTLDAKFDALNSNSGLVNFSDIRILAERECRQKLFKSEEVTLDEIYNYLVQKFHIKNEVAEKMKQAEIEAEVKYCQPRKSVVNLIQLAQAMNKKIVCTSDFYIGKSFIKRLLDKCNVNADEIFVSCEYGLTKHTGTLYQKVIEELKVKANEIVHIGDNWHSDFENAKNSGLIPVFYASCKNSFMYEISDIKASDSTSIYKRPSGMWINYEKSLKFFEVRCALALCANEIYDNPYYAYKEGTFFNGDANFIGYYALGMHLWAITKWLKQENQNKNGRIHFIARDGYLPKLAYDIVNKKQSARKSNYIYVSRKSLMPLVITDINNFYSLGNIIQLSRSTPKKLTSLFNPILNSQKLKELMKEQKEEVFGSEDQAYKFIDNVLTKAYDEKIAQTYRKNILQYFKAIVAKGDSFFDIGYSGRTQVLLANLLGFGMDTYFVHANDDMYTRKHKELDINVKCLYEYTPSMTGSIREFSISELSPSCVGYDFKYNCPVFEEFETNYPCKYSIEQLQGRALDFIKDMNHVFGIRDDFTARAMDLSMPYEYLLHHTPWDDTNYFSACEFEDDLYEGKSKVNLSQIWQRDMAYHRVLTYPSSNFSSGYYVQPVEEMGVYAKLYNKMNKMFPVGTKRRKLAKKIGKMLIGKNK